MSKSNVEAIRDNLENMHMIPLTKIRPHGVGFRGEKRSILLPKRLKHVASKHMFTTWHHLIQQLIQMHTEHQLCRPRMIIDWLPTGKAVLQKKLYVSGDCGLHIRHLG